MSGKRDSLARLLDRSGAVAGILRARAALRLPVLTVLTYHRVADLHGDELFDPEVVDATPEQFDQQLATITAHFNVIGIDELLTYCRGGALPANPCLITFDDGYLDCHEVALPLLEKHGARAVFFIATDYVSERRVYWWDRVHYLVAQSRVEVARLTYPEALRLDLAGARAASIHRILRIIKDTHGLDLERFLGDLSDALGVTWSRDIERQMADELVMTWDHVRGLRARGMDVQSHTRRHRVLHTLPGDRLDDELRGAREILESELGEGVRAIAYPVGKRIVDTPHLVRAVRDAGYEIGFSNVSGAARLSRTMNPYDISRLGMDRRLSPHLFRGMMAVPWLG